MCPGRAISCLQALQSTLFGSFDGSPQSPAQTSDLETEPMERERLVQTVRRSCGQPPQLTRWLIYRSFGPEFGRRADWAANHRK